MTDEDIDTSDIPPLDDAFFERAIRILPRVLVDRIDLIEARKYAAHILSRKKWSGKKGELQHDAFNLALIVSYAKPFSKSFDFEGRSDTRLDERVEVAGVLNQQEIQLHLRIKELRNQSYAHSDARSKLLKGIDYTKYVCLMKKPLNLSRSEVELLLKVIEKWIKYLDGQVSLLRKR